MFLRISLKILFIGAALVASYAMGRTCHESVQHRAHRRDAVAGEVLRSELSQRMKARRELESLKNQQEASIWELAEHRQRIAFARAAASAIEGFASPKSGRE